MEIYWLEQNEQSVPASNDWLGSNERTRLARFVVPKRLVEWRLGRWTAKCAIAAYWGLPDDPSSLANTEIRPAPSGAPQAFISGEKAALAISISHSHRLSLCTLSAPDVSLGCDVEWIEPRSRAFLEDYFTPEEQALVARMPEPRIPDVATFFWSAKESALKAMKDGLRLDTRAVIVRPGNVPSSAWSRFEIRTVQGTTLHGWSCASGGFVRTIVSDVPCCEPVPLQANAAGTSSDFPSSQDRYCTNVFPKGVPLVTSARGH